MPVFRDDVVVGDVKFELMGQKLEQNEELPDKKHPHTLSGCQVCHQTHMGPSGVPFSCHYCVCVKCNGTGVKIQDRKPCTKMKTM